MINMIDVDDPRLTELSIGGNVNLNLRPVIPTEKLIEAGWDEEPGNFATVFSYTETNDNETIAMNFTPIEVDTETGTLIQVHSPDIFKLYCKKIANSLIEDTYRLKIGKTFTGENCIKEAEAAAALIHEIHESYIEEDPPIEGDCMDLNVPGNSEQPNARYQFINPVAGLAYTTPQKIIFDWDVAGATKNPYVKKHVEFNIPANSHCFVLFTGKYVGVYCTAPTNFVMDVYNGTTPIGKLTKQSTGAVLEIQDLFGMYEGYKPEGGTYNVTIQTPFVFIRQIYKCASRDQLPQKGSPTYEIFQPGTSSAYVNPDDKGELAYVHFLKTESLAALKAAADAEYKGG